MDVKKEILTSVFKKLMLFDPLLTLVFINTYVVFIPILKPQSWFPSLFVLIVNTFTLSLTHFSLLILVFRHTRSH